MMLTARVAKLETLASPKVARRFYLLSGSDGFTNVDVAAVIREAGFDYDPEIDMAVVMVAYASVGLPLKLVGTPQDLKGSH